MEYFSKRTGICLFVIGIAMFLLNYFTSTWWNIDIDILGAMIAVLGLVIAIATSFKMKKSKKWLTRKNGIWLCAIGVIIEIIIGLLNLLGLSNNGGEFGAIIFVLGIILIAVRWKH
jgi:thiol:disulfide interchange protein